METNIKLNSMDNFIRICKGLLRSYAIDVGKPVREENHIVTVWCCKTLQNYKCVLSVVCEELTGIIAEYTYNGDKGEIYEDVYTKLKNTAYYVTTSSITTDKK